MFAPSRRVLPGLLLLSLTPLLLASGRLEADPHELYEATQGHLRNGDLKAADSSLGRLRDLVAPGSPWDPDGTFANQLLPPLTAKLKRLQAVARELDAFCSGSLQDLKLPDKDDGETARRAYADSAASLIQDLRARRDRIVTERIVSPDERAALIRTESYACTERLLETDVLKTLAGVPDHGKPELLSGDPRVDPVLTRFRQLKQDLMQIVAERDRLRQQVKSSAAREEDILAALADMTTHGALAGRSSRASGTDSVSDSFARFLDQEKKAVRLQASQTSAEREARRADLVRYRRYNALLVETRLGADQSDRINSLNRAVEVVRVKDEVPSKSSRVGPAYWVALAILTLIASLSAWLAVARGRRLASRHLTLGSAAPIHGAEAPNRSVDHHAA